MTDSILNIQSVSKRFGGNHVLTGIDFQVRQGEILALLGPNGSGKSTLLNVISGFLKPDGGTVRFNGAEIRQRAPHELARLGLARTFQLPSMPTKMSVGEVVVGGASQHAGLWRSLLRGPSYRVPEAQALAKAKRLLDSLLLTRVIDQPASAISGGQKKLLSLASCLMQEPQVILLDEPTAGVHPNLRTEMVKILKQVNASGVTLVVVEHDMHFISELCGRCVVLDRGQIVADCAPHEMASHPRVLEAYLGSSVERAEQRELELEQQRGMA
jgi:branched-chain amino acid transport system ATP-binding protein